MQTKKALWRSLAAMFTVLPMSIVAAEEMTEEQRVARGEAVVKEWDQCDYDFKDMTAEYRMVLEDGNGNQSERRARLKLFETFERDDAGLKTTGDLSIVVFNFPPDIAGTSVLVHAQLREADYTWVYLPTLGRVKRIASANVSGNFAGTEFAYEDIAAQEYYKFTYRWLRQEQCGPENAITCEVVEQVPQYPYSGYSKQISWYDSCQQWKIEYYNHRNEHVKTQTFDDYRQYHGKHWRGHNNKMINHINKRSTHIIIPKFTYGNGFAKRQFTPEVLHFSQ